ncbi:hypothetical protein PAJ34TS1_27970 [Paenibacillus azoreducens]|uniref:Uncharacterized protein n=1 Tax=Paenibacillus azoreducens TaxID=116718 RepID=A0A919Y930_9BACL|nr:hypothetical protein J34TS1_11460 [Paenibacillus azoreducens]
MFLQKLFDHAVLDEFGTVDPAFCERAVPSRRNQIRRAVMKQRFIQLPEELSRRSADSDMFLPAF